MTAQLFTPVELGGVTLPNRIVVSPMCQYAAVDGSAQPWHQVHYGMLAMSGAGLLCLEATHVERDGRITQGCLGLYSDENEAAIKSIVDWARAWMPTVKLGIQLAHAGRKASAQRPWKGGGPLTPGRCARPAVDHRLGLGHPLRCQVAHAGRARCGRPEAGQAGLRRGHAAQRAAGLRRRRAARRARLSLSQFLSPLSNQRSDEYGGTADKRRRFPLEVFEACRRVWPAGKAMGMRLSCVEWVEGGVTIEDTIETARQLKALGCDFIDASSGGNAAAQKIPVKPGYHVEFSARIRKEAGIKTWAVGVITEPEQAEAHHRRGPGRLHGPCTRLPARPALGLERRPGARRGNTALAAARRSRHNYPAVQASAHPGPRRLIRDAACRACFWLRTNFSFARSSSTPSSAIGLKCIEAATGQAALDVVDRPRPLRPSSSISACPTCRARR